MDVFLMVRRQKMTIFLDAKETTSVAQIKLMIEGILKVSPDDQRLLSPNNETMTDEKNLVDYGLSASEARAQAPAQLGLVLRDAETGAFETLEIQPLSNPPELPDVMKLPEPPQTIQQQHQQQQQAQQAQQQQAAQGPQPVAAGNANQ